jgi:putative endopeptidase
MCVGGGILSRSAVDGRGWNQMDGDAQQPDREILYLYQGGLGLPDRDYYLQDEARLREYREQYVGFVSNILKMADQPAPGATAREIFALESRLARAHWTNVESRDAVKTYNKVATADLGKQFPGFDWSAWTAELGVATRPRWW